MNRRDFLGLSIKGLFLGAAISSGLGRITLASPEPHPALGQRGYTGPIYWKVYPGKITVHKNWFAVVEQQSNG